MMTGSRAIAVMAALVIGMQVLAPWERVFGCNKLCEHSNYEGWCIYTERYSGDFDLRSIGWNDRISSFNQLQPEDLQAGIILYERPNCSSNFGERRFDRDVPDLGREKIGDQASSVRVRSGRWLLCEHANYRGRCQELAPSGRCESLERYGLDNKVSSLKRVKGTTRVSFRDPKIEGHALDYCREWGRNCGKPAADAFCRSRGYLRADSFRVRWDSPPTMTIGDRKLCRAPHCDRISEVVCAVE